jgi:Flp pilus assembly protein TadB
LINITNRNYERALFTTPMGLHMVYGALGLMAVGVLIIRHVVSIKV